MNEFKERFCDVCKEPKNRIENGAEILCRCSCDVERMWLERIAQTVHPDYWVGEDGKNKVRTLNDWNPPIFRNGGNCQFKNLIKIQKANVVYRLNEFCFDLIRKNPKQYAIEGSIAKGRALFVRGPHGSGRGTLMANIKIFAAGRDISATPNPSEWSIFKGHILAADSWSKTGDAAKDEITGRYENVSLLTLEDIKGEPDSRRFRSAASIDAVLSRRLLHPGAIVFTSTEFIKQIGDTIGDKIPEILLSDKTIQILMFSTIEADALLEAMTSKLTAFRLTAERIPEKETGLKAAAERELMLQDVEMAFYMEHAFPEIPSTLGSSKIKAGSLQMKLSMTNKYPEDLRQRWAAFCKDREEKTLRFHEMMDRTLVAAVKDCKELAAKMTQREMLETGKMMQLACSGKNEFNAYMDKARILRKAMQEW